MNTEALQEAVKDAIEQDVINAISEVDLSYYLNPKQIKIWVERVVRDQISRRAGETIELKIMKEIKKFDRQLDMEIQRLVMEEVSKHIKI